MTGANATRDPDSVLAAWLDEGPTDLPDATRRAILTALPTTPRARRSRYGTWRFPDMTPLARASVAILIAAVAIGGAYLLGRNVPSAGGPSPLPSIAAAPSPSPIDTTGWQIVNSLYRLTYRIPTDWTVAQGPVAYQLSPMEGAEDSGPATAGAYGGFFSVSSQRLAGPTDQAAWWSTFSWVGACHPSSKADFTQTVVDGVPADEWNHLTDCGVAHLVAFDGGYAYELTLVNVGPPGSVTPPDHTHDDALWAALLSTVVFNPAGDGTPTGS